MQSTSTPTVGQGDCHVISFKSHDCGSHSSSRIKLSLNRTVQYISIKIFYGRWLNLTRAGAKQKLGENEVGNKMRPYVKNPNVSR